MYHVENRKDYILAFVDEGFQQYEDSHASKRSDSSVMLDKMINETLHEIGHPAPVVLDLRKFKIKWTDLVMGLAETNKSESMFRNPNLSEVVVVAESMILKLGAKALNQTQYGGINVSVYENLEDALAHLKEMAVH